MKKIFLTIAVLFMVMFNGFGQEIKQITSNVNITKEIIDLQTPEGQFITYKNPTYLHINIQDFGSAGNVVHVYIEQNSTKIYNRIFENVTVFQKKNNCNRYDYIIADTNFIHLMYLEQNYENVIRSCCMLQVIEQ